MQRQRPSRMNGYGDTIAFIGVVQHGGFTAAAQATGVSKALVSRQVRNLEDRLGTALLKRSTRRLGLTEAGRAYFEECLPLIAGLAQADAHVAEMATRPEGPVVITAPAWFSASVLAPLLVAFGATNPGFQPEIVATHALVDLVSEEFDLAFRLWIGDLPDSLMTVRHLATLPTHVFAGTRVVAQRRLPTEPTELVDHPALVTHVRKVAERERWHLTNGATAGDYAIKAVAVASDPSVLETMMIAGNGLLLATDLQMRGAVTRGEAQPVLPGWSGRPIELYALLPAGRRSAYKVRLLLDFIAERLAAALST